MKKIVVFISSPYTIGDTAVNVKRQMDCANNLIEMGFIPYVPLLDHFLHMNNPQPYEKWLEIDFEFLLKCDCVLRLEGVSKGADKETKFAREHGIPVYYSIGEIIKEKCIRNNQAIKFGDDVWQL
jgi:hypothetical protein